MALAETAQAPKWSNGESFGRDGPGVPYELGATCSLRISEEEIYTSGAQASLAPSTVMA